MANLSYKPYIPVYWNPVIYPWHLTFWIFIQSIALRWESKAYSFDWPFWAPSPGTADFASRHLTVYNKFRHIFGGPVVRQAPTG